MGLERMDYTDETEEKELPETPSPIQGYGFEAWQRPEVTEQKALAKLKELTDEEFEFITTTMIKDMLPGGPHAGAIENHVRQVRAIGEQIARDSGNFETPEEMRLMTLTILSHDILKNLANFPDDLYVHAFVDARGIPGYLKNFGDYKEKGALGKPRREQPQLSPHLQEFFQTSDDLGNFLAKVVETHSSIPFIMDKFEYASLYRQEQLDKLAATATRKLARNRQVDPEEVKLLERLGKYGNMEEYVVTAKKGVIPDQDLPYLVETIAPDGTKTYELPTPENLPQDALKYARVLRAADTLSNYSVLPELEMPVMAGENPKLVKYSGYLKIMGMQAGRTFSEKSEGLAQNAQIAVDRGIYKGFPVAEELALESVARMKWLGKYFSEMDKTPVEFVGKKYKLEDLLDAVAFERKNLASLEIEVGVHDTPWFIQDVHNGRARVPLIAKKIDEIYTQAFEAMEKAETDGSFKPKTQQAQQRETIEGLA